mmetsp:Transcript_12581/g.33595  ORF Transcript_12581/g.33595 Transcript_12581/m.33595 type:complete len:272 (+) Transcript_12581:667-1482(+)
MVFACKGRLPGDELAEDAADGPHVYGHRVLRGEQDHLRRPIPAGHHVVGAAECILLLRLQHAREAEVADLEVAVLVHQQVRWLQVSVDNAGAVQVYQATKYLVHKVLVMLLCERLLGVDDPVKVRLHQVSDYVDVLEVWAGRREHVQDPYDIVMVKLPQQLHFPQDPLAIDEVIEGVADLLNRELLPGPRILERCDAAICTRADLFDQLQVDGNSEGRLVTIRFAVHDDLAQLVDGHPSCCAAAAPWRARASPRQPVIRPRACAKAASKNA